MTVLFVHGVPDTHRLWADVLQHLPDGDYSCLALPGIGCARPDGFSATKEAYADWLADELEAACQATGGPVHLVGHDWGSFLVQRVAGLHSDKVKSWAAGGIGIDEDYVWHDLARIWQTPGEGEALMASMDEAAITATLEEARVPSAKAAEIASFSDDTMKSSILALYRSAEQVGKDWADALPGLRKRPGLVLWGALDPYSPVAMGRKLADRTDARFEVFEDCGHWWPYERPRQTAEHLAAHWEQTS